MLFYLIIIFILIPIFEIYILLTLGSLIGAGFTLFIIIFTGITGSWLVRRQGILTFSMIQKDLSEGRMPADRIISGLFILIGGIFLITPGFFTDLIGFSLMIPGNRRFLVKYAKQRFSETNIDKSQHSFFPHNFGSNTNRDNEL